MKVDLRLLENSPLLKQQLFSRHCSQRGFSLLDSNRGNVGSSYLFIDPVACCWATQTHSYVRTSEEVQEYKGVWQVLDSWLDPLLTDLSSKTAATLPLVCGYLGYEMLHGLEQVQRMFVDNLKLPQAVLFLYRKVIEIPVDSRLPAKEWTVDGGVFDSVLSLSDSAFKNCSSLELSQNLAYYSNFSKEKYCHQVQRVIDLIRAGEVYQVNFTQQFSVEGSINPSVLYNELAQVSPASYGAYLNNFAPEGFDTFSVLSSSPERFFRLEGGRVECAPIKGTRPRGNTSQEDAWQVKELLNSEKDRAELAMIVDLIRNDLGRVCEPGSISVESHAELHSFAQVHHLISEVVGKLRHEASITNLLKALFPCGSITGCPKVAAMNYIAELEKTVRGVYTGSIGWMGLRKAAEFNVAIRTAVVLPDRCVFQAGGAVVVDSSPEAEYEESLVKANGIFKALKNYEMSISTEHSLREAS